MQRNGPLGPLRGSLCNRKGEDGGRDAAVDQEDVAMSWNGSFLRPLLYMATVSGYTGKTLSIELAGEQETVALLLVSRHSP